MDFSFICSMCGAVVRSALRSHPNDGREPTLSLGPGSKGTCKAWRPGRRWTEKNQRPGAAWNWKMMEMWWKCDGNVRICWHFWQFHPDYSWLGVVQVRKTNGAFVHSQEATIHFLGPTWCHILAGQQFLPCSTCNRCVCVFPGHGCRDNSQEHFYCHKTWCFLQIFPWHINPLLVKSH